MSTSKLELLRQLTIVILTYDRPEDLERCIEYWRDTPITVHILDGSNKSWFPIGVLPDIPNIYYHHIPSATTESADQNFARRMIFAATLPTTNYSALCADHDFFTISGLIASLETLNADDNIDAVVGHHLGYVVQNQVVKWWHRSALLQESLMAADSESVVNRANGDNSRTYYGICRTVLWVKRLELCFNQTFLIPNMNEILMNFIGRIMLRTRSIQEILWLTYKYRRYPENYLSDTISSGNYDKKELEDVISKIQEAIEFVEPNFLESSRSFATKLIHGHPSEIRPSPKRIQHRRRIELLVSKFPKIIQDLFKSLIPRKVYIAFGMKKAHRKLQKTTIPKGDLNLCCELLIEAGIAFEICDLLQVEELALRSRHELRLQANS